MVKLKFRFQYFFLCTGRHYIESRMSEWSTCSRSSKSSQILRHFVKPGRYYQFRVAAINVNGTKGFSDPSVPYSPSTGKKLVNILINVCRCNIITGSRIYEWRGVDIGNCCNR